MSRAEGKLGRQAGKHDLSWLAWLPVAGLAVAMIIVRGLDLRGIHESAFLVTALHFIFTSLVSVMIVYVAGRGFMLTGNSGLLWFGSGILVWGATSSIGAASVARSANTAVTIHNTGLLISAVCHLTGALRTGTDRKPILTPGPSLVLAAAGAAGIVGLLVIATFDGRLPAFFVQGQGGTPLRFGVLGSAAGLYLASASLMMIRSRSLTSRFLFWYSAGLVLLACGALGIMFEPVVGGVLSWLGRSAQYLGGAYLAVAAIVSGAEARVWGVSVEGKRRQAEQELAADLDAMTRLQKLGALSAQAGNLEPVLTEIVDTAIAISGADFGNIQLFDPASGDLRIAAQRGFPPWWLEFWNSVAKGKGACGTALARGERVIIENVERSPIFKGTPALDIQRKAGVRAVQSTPLVSRSGKPVGMFSTHYRKPRRPDHRALRLLDLLARQAADVVEHAQAEVALGESRAKYKALTETTSDFIWEVDTSGKYTYCSPQMETLWGIKSEEMIGKTPFDQMPPEAREEGLQFYRGFVESRSPFSGIQVPSLDVRGNLVTIEISGVPFFDGRNQLLGYRGISRDVTARKKTEEALRESEARLQDFFNNASGIVWVKDLDGRFLKINSFATAALGRPAGDFIGRTVREIYPGSQGDAYAGNDRQVIEAGSSMEFEETLELADGLHTFMSVKFPVRDSGGKIYGVGAVCTDITEKKRLEDLLHVKSREQETILDSAPAMIFYKDAENRFLRVNKAFEEVMSLSKEELEGRSLFDLYPHEQAESYWKDDLEVIRTGKPKFNIIEQMETSHGRRLLQTDKIPYIDESGAIRGVIGLSLDITERKKAEEILKRDRETLEQLVRERTAQLLQAHEELDRARRLSDIGVLAATVAHELRSPLAAISMAVHNIKRKAGNGSFDRHIANIDKKISESDQIINNLLFYSRLQLPHFEKVNMLDVLEESIESADDKNKRETSIIRDVDSLRNVSVEADPFQMKEIFVNVLNNAYDAIPEDKGEIRIASEVDDDDVTISFQDNGPGIPRDIMDKIFDPFFTTKARGIGLGLVVCRQIVDMHGGQIGIRDDFTKGTCVVVSLPRRRDFESPRASASR